MAERAAQSTLYVLEPLVGRWRMTMGPDPTATGPSAFTTFEWMTGGQFLIQRWEVDHPDAPDGMALIGLGGSTATYLQHYFDSRGVARVYEMELADGVWTLHRLAQQPDFSQRFTGRLSDDGNAILGTWEMAPDGSTWSVDFDLTYTKVG